MALAVSTLSPVTIRTYNKDTFNALIKRKKNSFQTHDVHAR
jgi:hypothetical protein